MKMRKALKLLETLREFCFDFTVVSIKPGGPHKSIEMKTPSLCEKIC